jgi:acylphosphatase
MEQAGTGITRYRIFVTGKVQGVWYRKSAVDKGNELGLAGFAKNMKDGSVLIEAEGAKERLDSFVRWCEQGPPMARVDEVRVDEASLSGYSGFVVKY